MSEQGETIPAAIHPQVPCQVNWTYTVCWQTRSRSATPIVVQAGSNAFEHSDLRIFNLVFRGNIHIDSGRNGLSATLALEPLQLVRSAQTFVRGFCVVAFFSSLTNRTPLRGFYDGAPTNLPAVLHPQEGADERPSRHSVGPWKSCGRNGRQAIAPSKSSVSFTGFRSIRRPNTLAANRVLQTEASNL
jgi:hypothetical protein